MNHSVSKIEVKRPLCIIGLSMIMFTLLYMFTYDTIPNILICILFALDFILCIIHAHTACRFTVLLTLAAVVASILFFYNESCIVKPTEKLIDTTVSISGVVYESPVKKENSTLIKIEDCKINEKTTKLKMNLYCRATDPVSIGDIIIADAADIFAAAEQNEFYYHTLSTGVWLRAYTGDASKTGARDTSLHIKMQQFRNDITKSLTDALEGENGAIAAALLIGDKSALSSEFKTDLRIAGASHLFAVSGMHLSIWSAVLFFGLRKIAKLRNSPYIIATAFVLFYMTLTGFSPSVLRSGIMLITIYIGNLVKKQADPLNSLCLSAILLLIFNIYLAGNISFLLSFFATFAIVAVYPIFEIKYKTKRRRSLKQKLLNLFNVTILSLLVLVVTAPISGFFFGCVSLLSPVSSLICTLPVQITMISTFIGLSTGFIPPLEKISLYMTNLSCKGISFAIQHLSQLQYLVVPVNPVLLLIWYLCTSAVMLCCYLKYRNAYKTMLPLLLSLSLLISGVCIKNILQSDQAEVFIPSGENSTNICVNTGKGTKCILIGTGKAYNDVKKMTDYFKHIGVYRPDALIVPRLSEAEAGNIEQYTDSATNIYIGDKNYTFQFSDRNIYLAERFSLSFGNGLTYTNYNTPAYTAAILRNENVKIVFCFYPASDFSLSDKELNEADYLICRGDVPYGINTANYRETIVMTDKTSSELHLPTEIKTTADTGDVYIQLKMKGIGS